MPDTALALSAAIAGALYLAREREETPVALIMDPGTRNILEAASLGTWWDQGGRLSLFNLPVEIDPGAEGWTVRVR